MPKEKITLIVRGKDRGGDIDCKFTPDGETVILTYKDDETQEIEMIGADEVDNYEEIGIGIYPDMDVFHAISRGINLYEGNFLEDVCAYHIEEGGQFIFYKEKRVCIPLDEREKTEVDRIKRGIEAICKQ